MNWKKNNKYTPLAFVSIKCLNRPFVFFKNTIEYYSIVNKYLKLLILLNINICSIILIVAATNFDGAINADKRFSNAAVSLTIYFKK